jgi:cell division protein FtsQ
MRTAATVALRSLPRAALALPPAWRRRVAAVLGALALLGLLYMGWFRDSSFARVEKVEISGLSGPQARAIHRALVAAGMDMTTLHVRGSELRDAVATYPVVRSVTASGDFPHLLRIDVQLNLPVAALQTAAGKIPVTSDGLLLRDVPLTSGLPLLAAGGAAPPERVDAGRAFMLLTAVAAAPPAMRPRIRSVVVRKGDGLVAHMRRGPDLIFGGSDRMAAKWIAAVRVLSSPSAKGATYIDLRLPERPAAGGLPSTGLLPLAPAGADAGTAPVTPADDAATGATSGTATTPATSTETSATTAPPPTSTVTGPAPAATQTTPAPTPTTPAPATTGGAVEAPN